jgi:hypothetical protein
MIRHQNNYEPDTRSNAIGQPDCVRGIVQLVDTVQRELTVLMHNGLAVVDIPPDCPIVLHGERIKLRMVQPRDHVRIRLAEGDTLPTAKAVEVQPDTGFSCFRL